ncbi:hypothetical protein [Sphingopyxis sp.]|uniref:hypothetical protein n=1 Tax=Sphingopyxis sp. TaxID=1908224 RepID=UPI0035ADC7CF
MAKFDMGAAWEDSIALLKAHSALTGAIAAVFLFLPTLVVAWFGPAPAEPPAGATVDQILTIFQDNIRQVLPYQLGVALFALVGTVAILRLWLSRTGTSVGEAIGFAFRLLPTMIVVQILTGFILGLGFILLIVPGLYLIGRLALVSPVVADRGLYNPLEAIGESWNLTRDNGWSIFFFLFLVMIVVGITVGIVTLVVSAVVGAEPGAGRIISGFFESALGVAASMLSIAISTAAYRQLASGGDAGVFE